MNTYHEVSSPRDEHAQGDASAPPLSLPRLPYAEDALAPVISARTVGFHHGKHQKNYIDTLNKLITETDLADQPLEAIVRASAGKADKAKIFNNAAQAWNHAFYWRCLKPGGGGDPTGTLRDQIAGAFGSVDRFRKELSEAAIAQFGSGWAWLVADGSKLKIVKTANADVPLVGGQTPLLTLDVWSTPTISTTKIDAPIMSTR
jgi:superoxide dismutase, Fe-Mn family